MKMKPFYATYAMENNIKLHTLESSVYFCLNLPNPLSVVLYQPSTGSTKADFSSDEVILLHWKIIRTLQIFKTRLVCICVLTKLNNANALPGGHFDWIHGNHFKADIQSQLSKSSR